MNIPSRSYASPPAAQGVLAAAAASIASEHGADVSGFRLLDRNRDGLDWRLALIDSAESSIDAQYYLWYGDATGRILMKRLMDAANRGVKVRLLVDDLNTLLQDAVTVGVRDDVAVWVDAHPNLELRLFNPWTRREFSGRIGESATDFERVNHRMHNKALIVDNRAAIIGGRNVGNEYMGLNPDFNFHDLDVLGVGPVAAQASKVFDNYWNSRWIVPATALGLSLTDDESRAGYNTMRQRLREDDELVEVPLEPRSWETEFDTFTNEMHVGTSEVVADIPLSDSFDMIMLDRVRAEIGAAQNKLVIVNAYIIPADHGINLLASLGQRGADVTILTNSLASHDVPAVNSHYRKWRKPILETGAELYELRHDADIQSSIVETPPVRAEFVGLHSKAMLVDDKRVFIGSMNYDPRSAIYNTEMGVFIDSPGLGEEVARLFERNVSPKNSWQVKFNDKKKLVWVNDEEEVSRQPARSFWQRVEDFFFRAVPSKYY